MHQGAAGIRPPPTCPPNTRCQVRARTRCRGQDRPRPRAAARTVAAAPRPAPHSPGREWGQGLFAPQMRSSFLVAAVNSSRNLGGLTRGQALGFCRARPCRARSPRSRLRRIHTSRPICRQPSGASGRCINFVRQHTLAPGGIDSCQSFRRLFVRGSVHQVRDWYGGS